jgi:hypothetical protein
MIGESLLITMSQDEIDEFMSSLGLEVCGARKERWARRAFSSISDWFAGVWDKLTVFLKIRR